MCALWGQGLRLSRCSQLRLASSHGRCKFNCSLWLKSVQRCCLILMSYCMRTTQCSSYLSTNSGCISSPRPAIPWKAWFKIFTMQLLSPVREMSCNWQFETIRWHSPRFDCWLLVVWAATDPLLLGYTFGGRGRGFKARYMDHYDRPNLCGYWHLHQTERVDSVLVDDVLSICPQHRPPIPLNRVSIWESADDAPGWSADSSWSPTLHVQADPRAGLVDIDLSYGVFLIKYLECASVPIGDNEPCT